MRSNILGSGEVGSVGSGRKYGIEVLIENQGSTSSPMPCCVVKVSYLYYKLEISISESMRVGLVQVINKRMYQKQVTHSNRSKISSLY